MSTNKKQSQLVANIRTHQRPLTSFIRTPLIYTSRKQIPPVCVSVYMSHVRSTPAALKIYSEVVNFEAVRESRKTNGTDANTGLDTTKNQCWENGVKVTMCRIQTRLSHLLKYTIAASLYKEKPNCCCCCCLPQCYP